MIRRAGREGKDPGAVAIEDRMHLLIAVCGHPDRGGSAFP
jgi:hypothetical protein